MSGAAPRYSVGDSVSLNCTSNSSDPLAELSWYINSESVGVELHGNFLNILPIINYMPDRAT